MFLNGDLDKQIGDALEGWWKSNRGCVIIGACLFVAGFVAGMLVAW